MFRNRLSPAEAAQGLASVFNILILKRRRIAEPARLGRERRLPRAWMAQGKSASGKVPASRSSPIAFPLKPAARRLDPVSYTHLDVYKRQTPGITVPEMKAKLRRLKDVDLVIIDYLQLKMCIRDRLMGGALDGPVVRLAAAGGEENFAGLRVEAAGNVLTGGFHRLFRVPNHGIHAGWIAVVLSIIRKHGFHHGLRYRGSG